MSIFGSYFLKLFYILKNKKGKTHLIIYVFLGKKHIF